MDDSRLDCKALRFGSGEELRGLGKGALTPLGSTGFMIIEIWVERETPRGLPRGLSVCFRAGPSASFPLDYIPDRCPKMITLNTPSVVGAALSSNVSFLVVVV